MISSGVISVTIGMLPAMKITEPYSPTARAKASAKPVSSAGSSAGRMTRRKVCQRPAPRRRGGLLQLGLESSSTGCTVRTTNGRPMKVSATTTPSGVKATLMPSGSSGCPIQPFSRVERGQRDAGDRGRQRERQIDQRVDEPLAGKAVAHQHPGDEQAEDRVDQRGDQRRAESQAVRGQHARRRSPCPERGPGQREGLEERRRQRDQHDQAQVQQREAQREAEARATRFVAAIGARRSRQSGSSPKFAGDRLSYAPVRSGRRRRRRRSASSAPSASRRTARRW